MNRGQAERPSRSALGAELEQVAAEVQERLPHMKVFVEDRGKGPIRLTIAHPDDNTSYYFTDEGEQGPDSTPPGGVAPERGVQDGRLPF